ncbi:uncharacterized protein LOC107039370 [Diachasma alloeum]|uniref:uncharacterized protein LOC107039370 n=1 Tax=Diachasma alloeum TaxID=454923 RepID=UPI000738250E|nr:uncharacterized protein LOC107039370 [Diachasma alloeum]XP_015114426.1 uncharacterized protein LOC107039370 [Diachasma alloeum]XP_015114427.1 uncharacterized protein LOC107039370 [Diachasma alloeum]
MYLQAFTIGLGFLTVFAQPTELPTKNIDILETLIDCVQNYNATAHQLEAKKSDHKATEGRSNCLESCFRELRENLTKTGVFTDKEVVEKISKESSGDSHLKSAVISCTKDRNAEGVDDCKSTRRLLDCLKQKIDCPNRNDCILRILFTVNGA